MNTPSPRRADGPPLWIALMHHPVLDRTRRVVTTAITNLDVHDIARSARTYGLRGYFVVTPIETQRELARRIIEHWSIGRGADRVPERGEALRLASVVSHLDAAVARVADSAGRRPLLVATSARTDRATMTFGDLRQRLRRGDPVILLLGTGWGFAAEFFDHVDEVLEPIMVPGSDYNHLSVRSAASIMMDRLVGWPRSHC